MAAKLNFVLLLVVLLQAGSIFVPAAAYLSLDIGFSPSNITIFCPPSSSPPLFVLPKDYPLPPAAMVDYHVVPGTYNQAALQALPNSTVLPTSLPGFGILVTHQNKNQHQNRHQYQHKLVGHQNQNQHQHQHQPQNEQGSQVSINGIDVTKWGIYTDHRNGVVVHAVQAPFDPSHARNGNHHLSPADYFRESTNWASPIAYQSACYLSTRYPYLFKGN